MINSGETSKKDRSILSSWLIVSCFFFIVIQWEHCDLLIKNFSTGWKELISWQRGWLIFGLTCIITFLVNLLYRNFVNINIKRRQNIFLVLGIVTNLLILGFFKYYNFFIENIERLILSFNFDPQVFRLNIILPIGVSFYTFKSMTYTIDIYRGKLKPTDNYLDFALYVAFFPSLLAGPIDRAINLLPQFYTKRKLTIDQTARGLYLIFYGLFKKVAIADGVIRTVNQIFGSTGQISWMDVVIGTLLFTIQIYCDFSGYTDIARGTAKLFGIDLMTNFNLPYFSQNPREFWSRWHISLSTWLRDYLYIPLGGNKKGVSKTYRNLMLTMVLGGLWHGAAWNFVLWGFYHGLLLCLHRIIGSVKEIGKISSNIFIKYCKILFCFISVSYGWMLFRSTSLDQIVNFSVILVRNFGNLDFGALSSKPRFSVLLALPLFLLIELIENRMNGQSFYKTLPIPAWTAIFALMVFALISGLTSESSQFIYFNF
jgi:D-alanyl-lipoteichoic acid acyltransferase DltB (MBOAT superfamily)